MKLHTAKKRLYRAGLDYLIPVLNLIVKNVNNRKESIWQLMSSAAKRGTRRKSSI